MNKTPKQYAFEKQFPPEMNELSARVVDAAYVVHKTLGPGLLENVYEICLAHELRKRGLKLDVQKQIPVNYDGLKMDLGFRADLIVEDKIIIELKTVEMLTPVHQAQILTYMKLTGCQLGLLLNFNVPVLKNGIKRMALSGEK